MTLTAYADAEHASSVELRSKHDDNATRPSTEGVLFANQGTSIEQRIFQTPETCCERLSQPPDSRTRYGKMLSTFSIKHQTIQVTHKAAFHSDSIWLLLRHFWCALGQDLLKDSWQVLVQHLQDPRVSDHHFHQLVRA